MKIPIIIQDKKYQIKSIFDLTTSEFIELSKIENMDMVKYIQWQTGVKMKDAFFAVISPTLEKAIGYMKDITKLKKPACFDYKKTIATVGQRHQVEACKKTNYELLVFCLAVSQAMSNNIDDVNKLYDEYMDRPYTEILPAGFFFYKSLKHGKS